MAKKHHMTKHEYNAKNRKHHSRSSLRIEEEESIPTSGYGTHKKKSDMDMKKRLRTIRGYSGEMSAGDEEYDDVE
jgi:hypothetical protein